MFAHIGLNHKSAPVHVRERFAFNKEENLKTLHALLQQGLSKEAVLISTCNRVELYVSGETSLEKLLQFLSGSRNIPYTGDLQKSFYFGIQEETVRHLFKVVSGLDSMALGETEILGQVKNAYEMALENHFSGVALNKIFQDAFRVAKQIRTQTDIQKGHISVANVAVELASKIFSNLESLHVLVIGAGDTSEKTAKAMLSRGASRLSITNRTFERSQKLAEELGGKAIDFNTWTQDASDADIIVSGTSAPNYILTLPLIKNYMAHRINHPLLLIDIAVPRDIDPEIEVVENVYLYNIDDLQKITTESLQQRQQQIILCERIIEDKVSAFFKAWTQRNDYLSRKKQIVPDNLTQEGIC